jgi:uncharacterized membrane protein YgcG
MQTNTSIILVFALAQKRISKYGIRPCLPVVPARRRPVVPARRGGGGKEIGPARLVGHPCSSMSGRPGSSMSGRPGSSTSGCPGSSGGGGEDVESKCTGHFGLFL